jgi:hypothetical protein
MEIVVLEICMYVVGVVFEVLDVLSLSLAVELTLNK